MILGIDIPKNSTVVISNGKVLICFDENLTSKELWKSRFELWLTYGDTENDFWNRPLVNKESNAITITHNNKIELHKAKV